MKRVLTLLGGAGVLILGLTAAVALAAGSGGRGDSTSSSTTVATAPTPAATTTAASTKVWLCHHTGSWKHPYHLIHVSVHSVAAHRRHGDLDPGAGNSCPNTQPAGTKAHGKSGEAHGANAGAKDDASDKDDANDDDGPSSTHS
jgi:hypothetical protein